MAEQRHLRMCECAARVHTSVTDISLTWRYAAVPETFPRVGGKNETGTCEKTKGRLETRQMIKSCKWNIYESTTVRVCIHLDASVYVS